MPVSLPRECRADVYQDEQSLVVEIDLPGVAAEDVQLKVDTHVVSVRGLASEQDRHRYYRRERGARAFTRDIPLPVPVRCNLVGADFANGVLTIRLNPVSEFDTPSKWVFPTRSDEALPC